MRRPELAQGEDREGVGPGERGRRAREAGVGIDPLRQRPGRGGGTAEVGEEGAGASDGRRGGGDAFLRVRECGKAQALQAVGAVQGSEPPLQPSPGVIP